jgi:hypothetical protein
MSPRTSDSYDTPPENPNPTKMVWKELEKKADKAVMEAKMEGLEKDIERIDQTASKPHACAQEKRLADAEGQSKANQEAVTNMYKWFARGFGALVIVLLTSGVMFVWYLAGLSYNLEANNNRLEKLEAKQNDVRIAPALDPASLEPMLQRVAATAAAAAAQEASKATAKKP